MAIARDDTAAATQHAAAVQKVDPHLPLPQFVAGRVAYNEERYEDALAAFKEAVTTVQQAGTTLAELHLNLGNTYARLDRYAEAEAEFQEELREYPHNIGTYASLAMLYRASNREQAVEHVIGDLVCNERLEPQVWQAGDQGSSKVMHVARRNSWQCPALEHRQQSVINAATEDGLPKSKR